ncbi:MAG TPA: hypothetical protein VI197_20305 [Polyangiaceae bacterium]
MREGLSANDEALPDDLQAAFAGYEQRGEWLGAISLLLAAAEQRTDVQARVACYRKAAALFERQFGNMAEAQAILEYVLRLAPDEPATVRRLRELYTRARRRDKLRLLEEDPRRLAAHAPVPRPLPASGAGVSARASGLPARIAAAGLFVAPPAVVIAANVHMNAITEAHDNAGGVLGWLNFALLDLVFCALFVAGAWLPARWALARVGGSALFAMLALLSATFLLAMVPTLGWSTIDAANVLLDSKPPSVVTVRVVEHARWGKGRSRFPEIQEQRARAGTTVLLRSLGLEPVGSEHALRRGKGFFRRPYYLPALSPRPASLR